MTALYKRVEEQEEVKPVLTSVKFNADYDISDSLWLYGNWARKEVYKKQNTLNIFTAQPRKWKECCNDEDGLLLDSMVTSLLRINTLSSKDEHKVITLTYIGKEIELDETIRTTLTKSRNEKNYIYKPQTSRQVADEMGIPETTVRTIKGKAESYIIGMLAMQTMLTGQELELLQNIRLLK